jgi:hypothetical protein
MYHKSMENIVDLLILGLATFRVSSLFAREDGPAEIFEFIRFKAGVKYNDKSEPYGSTELAKGLLCVWCNSVWFALFFTAIYLIWNPFILFLLPFAVSSIAIIIHELTGNK